MQGSYKEKVTQSIRVVLTNKQNETKLVPYTFQLMMESILRAVGCSFILHVINVIDN